MSGSRQFSYEWPIGFVAGDDFSTAFTFTNADGTPYVPSSATIQFFEWRSDVDVPGIVDLTLVSNIVGLSVTDANSIKLKTGGGVNGYGYMITLVKDGNVRATIGGEVTVLDRRWSTAVSEPGGTFVIPAAATPAITVVAGGISAAQLTALIAAERAISDLRYAKGLVGPTQPTASGEYVWFKTDGAGTLLDILSGSNP